MPIALEVTVNRCWCRLFVWSRRLKTKHELGRKVVCTVKALLSLS